MSENLVNKEFQLNGMIALDCSESYQQAMDKTSAEHIGNQLAKDLAAIIPATRNKALAFCAAAFPVEQILQPGLPVFKALNKYATAAFQGQLNQHKILSIGANDGLMPKLLRPDSSEQSFLVMPFMMMTDDAELAECFEKQLMHKGMASPPMYQLLCDSIKRRCNHVNYMTTLDLTAMMHNHYEQMGVSDLWHIIEKALLSKDAKLVKSTASHNYFYLAGSMVFSAVFSYRQFQDLFCVESDEENLYSRWLLNQRLYLETLQVHGLEVHQFKVSNWPLPSSKICLGSLQQQTIGDDYFVEKQGDLKPGTPVNVIIYDRPEVGVFAISVQNTAVNSQYNYFPIRQSGIDSILALVENGYQVINSQTTQNTKSLETTNL
ncbi:MAG: hypothetical protein L3J52_04390 [Proteobacteria bacterium]|nr:hypothetical protein [Pseudomonadota bacterium]